MSIWRDTPIFPKMAETPFSPALFVHQFRCLAVYIVSCLPYTSHVVINSRLITGAFHLTLQCDFIVMLIRYSRFHIMDCNCCVYPLFYLKFIRFVDKVIGYRNMKFQSFNLIGWFLNEFKAPPPWFGICARLSEKSVPCDGL